MLWWQVWQLLESTRQIFFFSFLQQPPPASPRLCYSQERHKEESDFRLLYFGHSCGIHSTRSMARSCFSLRGRREEEDGVNIDNTLKQTRAISSNFQDKCVSCCRFKKEKKNLFVFFYCLEPLGRHPSGGDRGFLVVSLLLLDLKITRQEPIDGRQAPGIFTIAFNKGLATRKRHILSSSSTTSLSW